MTKTEAVKVAKESVRIERRGDDYFVISGKESGPFPHKEAREKASDARVRIALEEMGRSEEYILAALANWRKSGRAWNKSI